MDFHLLTETCVRECVLFGHRSLGVYKKWGRTIYIAGSCEWSNEIRFTLFTGDILGRRQGPWYSPWTPQHYPRYELQQQPNQYPVVEFLGVPPIPDTSFSCQRITRIVKQDVSNMFNLATWPQRRKGPMEWPNQTYVASPSQKKIVHMTFEHLTAFNG